MMIVKVLFAWAVVVMMCGCETKTLIDPGEIPYTENGTVVDGDRYFFIGGATLFELLKQPDGHYDYAPVTSRDDCMFTGLTSDPADGALYVACMANDPSSTEDFPPILWSDLIRVELPADASQQARISTTRLEGANFFPNGMAVDRAGNIYISNSYSTVASVLFGETHPAMIRVSIADEALFEIEKTPVLSAEQGGLFPNGVQILRDRLFWVGGDVVYEASIQPSGLADIKSVHTAPENRLFDDFAILPNHILAITEIPYPFALDPSSEDTGETSEWPPTDDSGQLTFVSVCPNKHSCCSNEVVWEYVFEPPIMPSSAMLLVDDAGPALIVTDYFNGGIHSVSLPSLK
jgi:hypothetical protein